MIRDAIEKGISAGFRRSLAEWCDGYDDPQERCEMRPCDGCACLVVRWERLPWWRKLMTRKPPEPVAEAVFDALLRLRVEEAVSRAQIARRKATK